MALRKFKGRSHRKSKGRAHRKSKSHTIQRGSGSGCRANANADWRNVDNMSNIKQTGGSPQSEIVMDESMQGGVMFDYINSPRICQNGYNGGSTGPMCQGGGSSTSDMVMNNLSDNAVPMQYQPSPKVIGNMDSLNLYQTTGGGKTNSSNKPKMGGGGSKMQRGQGNQREQRGGSKKQRGGSKKQRGGSKKQHGGGSDWIMSNYSQGNINAPGQPNSWVGNFGSSQSTGRDMLMNPSSMGLAGSGFPMGSLEGANVSMTGAPI